jgi:hypothetical protein
LHEEDPSALVDDNLDRLALAGAEGNVRPSDRVQQLEGAIGHAGTLPDADDTHVRR